MKDKDLEFTEDEIEDDLEDELDPEDEDYEGCSGFTVARGFAAGLIVGALVGAGVAILMAPERGEILRRRIGSGLREIQDDARDQLEDWRGDAGRELSKQRRKLARRLRKVRRR
jgi:hypothetical protein